MRKLKQLSLAVALMIALSTYALAGIIDCPPAPTPPPEPITFTGTIETPPSAQATEEPSDPILDLALSIVRVLSVF